MGIYKIHRQTAGCIGQEYWQGGHNVGGPSTLRRFHLLNRLCPTRKPCQSELMSTHSVPSSTVIAESALSTSSQKVVIGISKPMFHLILHLQPCLSFIPYALVFGVHWTPVEVIYYLLFFTVVWRLTGPKGLSRQGYCQKRDHRQKSLMNGPLLAVMTDCEIENMSSDWQVLPLC